MRSQFPSWLTRIFRCQSLSKAWWSPSRSWRVSLTSSAPIAGHHLATIHSLPTCQRLRSIARGSLPRTRNSLPKYYLILTIEPADWSGIVPSRVVRPIKFHTILYRWMAFTLISFKGNIASKIFPLVSSNSPVRPLLHLSRIEGSPVVTILETAQVETRGRSRIQVDEWRIPGSIQISSSSQERILGSSTIRTLCTLLTLYSASVGTSKGGALSIATGGMNLIQSKSPVQLSLVPSPIARNVARSPPRPREAQGRSPRVTCPAELKSPHLQCPIIPSLEIIIYPVLPSQKSTITSLPTAPFIRNFNPGQDPCGENRQSCQVLLRSILFSYSYSYHIHNENSGTSGGHTNCSAPRGAETKTKNKHTSTTTLTLLNMHLQTSLNLFCTTINILI